MKKTTISILFLLSYLNIFPKIQQKQNEPKPKIKAKTGNCCVLNVLESKDKTLKLTQICNEESSTAFYFEQEQEGYSCNIIENISLVDNQGNKYKATSARNQSRCGESNLIKTKSFIWVIEKLKPNVKSFDLYESEVDWTRAWNWRNVSTSHCNLK